MSFLEDKVYSWTVNVPAFVTSAWWPRFERLSQNILCVSTRNIRILYSQMSVLVGQKRHLLFKIIFVLFMPWDHPVARSRRSLQKAWLQTCWIKSEVEQNQENGVKKIFFLRPLSPQLLYSSPRTTICFPSHNICETSQEVSSDS